jgi:DNA-binding NtrC family response regulator
VVPLRVPPLRERREDIVPLVSHFLRKLVGEGKPLPPLSADAQAALLRYPWPGNVRQLRNVIERALAMNPGASLLTIRDLTLD